MNFALYQRADWKNSLGQFARTQFGLILALWAAGLCAAAQFAKVSVIFQDLRAVYPEAGTWAGFLVTLISFMGVVLGLFAGMIVTRFGFRRPILLALVLGAALSFYQATLPWFPLMLASRFVEGLSHLIIVVAAPTLIARISSDRHRPMVMTLWSTFFGVAFALVAWLGVPLAKDHGLPALFVAHGVAMLVVVVVLFAMLPYRDSAVVARALTLGDFLRQHDATYRSAFTSAPGLGWLFYTLSFVSLLTLLPASIPLESRGLAVTLMPLATIAMSMTLGVLLLRVMSAVRVIVVGFVLAFLCALALWFTEASAVAAVALFASLGLVQGATFAAVPELNRDPAQQAMANGALAQMGNLGNLSGTIIVLVMTEALGFAGLVGFALACYAAGTAVHLVLEARRK